jgi:hypothetical protein
LQIFFQKRLRGQEFLQSFVPMDLTEEIHIDSVKVVPAYHLLVNQVRASEFFLVKLQSRFSRAGMGDIMIADVVGQQGTKAVYYSNDAHPVDCIQSNRYYSVRKSAIIIYIQ